LNDPDQIEGKIQDAFPVTGNKLGNRFRGASNRVDPIGPRKATFLAVTRAVTRITQSQQCSPSSQGHPKGVSLRPLYYAHFHPPRLLGRPSLRRLSPSTRNSRSIAGYCHLCSFRLASTPRSPLSFCRTQMNLRKSLNYNPTLLI
jgi:hypothetical protein